MSGQESVANTAEKSVASFWRVIFRKKRCHGSPTCFHHLTLLVVPRLRTPGHSLSQGFSPSRRTRTEKSFGTLGTRLTLLKEKSPKNSCWKGTAVGIGSSGGGPKFAFTVLSNHFQYRQLHKKYFENSNVNF